MGCGSSVESTQRSEEPYPDQPPRVRSRRKSSSIFGDESAGSNAQPRRSTSEEGVLTHRNSTGTAPYPQELPLWSPSSSSKYLTTLLPTESDPNLTPPHSQGARGSAVESGSKSPVVFLEPLEPTERGSAVKQTSRYTSGKSSQRERLVHVESGDPHPLPVNTLSPTNASIHRRRSSTPGLLTIVDVPRCRICDERTDLFVCRQCVSFYICSTCVFDNRDPDHAPLHQFDRVQQYGEEADVAERSSISSLSNSQTKSSLALTSLMHAPCRCCRSVIADGEDCFRCELCPGYIICSECGENERDKHDPAHRFLQIKRKANLAKSTTSLRKQTTQFGQKMLNEYYVVRTIGKGAHGKVKLIQHIRSHQLFALKALKRASLSKNLGKNEPETLREIAIMKVLKHPHVLSLHEVIDDPESEKLYLILELMDGVVYTVGAPPLPRDLVREYSGQALKGLLYLHSQVIYHRDVKPENLLVRDGVVKVSDFGVSQSQGGSISDTKGTPAFLCPEIIEGLEVPGEMVDAWAFGVTVYCMAVGRLPFPTSTTTTELFDAITQRRIQYPAGLEPTLLEVLQALLAPRIADRADLRKVARLPYYLDFAIESAFERITVSEEMTENAFVRCRKVEKHFRRLCEPPRRHQDTQDLVFFELSPVSDPFSSPPTSPLSTVVSPQSRLIRSPKSLSLSGPSTDHDESKATLSLENMHFDNVPVELIMATKPLGLTLRQNGLTRFDFPVNSLANLKQLHIVDNLLTEFPMPICSLTKLTKLSLSTNRIPSVPAEIGNMTELRVLNIDNNLLTELPEGLSRLPKLRHCNAACNTIRILPDWLPSCFDLCLAVDNYPQSQLDWVQKKLQQCRTVTVLWNSIFPTQVADRLFVGTKEHDTDAIAIELGITTVLRSQAEMSNSLSQSGGADHQRLRRPTAESYNSSGSTVNDSPFAYALGGSAVASPSRSSVVLSPPPETGSPTKVAFQTRTVGSDSPHKATLSKTLLEAVDVMRQLLRSQDGESVLVCLVPGVRDPLLEVVAHITKESGMDLDEAENAILELLAGYRRGV